MQDQNFDTVSSLPTIVGVCPNCDEPRRDLDGDAPCPCGAIQPEVADD